MAARTLRFFYLEGEGSMSLINIDNLTFGYIKEENIFDHVSFQIDTEWKLGLIGRNGKGKTTFLKLLTGEYEYSGKIEASAGFDYFPAKLNNTGRNSLEVIRNMIAPFTQWETQMQKLLADSSQKALNIFGEINDEYTASDGYIINELIEREISKLDVSAEVLHQNFETLSSGEKLKLQLAGLFLKKNRFLLLDEPFSHLDSEGRQKMAQYLKSKKGFILVSHERELLDETVDHILSVNRENIELQKGNYTSWRQNKDYRDQFELNENEKLGKEIQKLQTAARRTSQWSDQIEKTKIGSGCPDRGYIGHKSAKMMARSKAIEKRQARTIEEKSALLKDLDKKVEIVLKPLEYVKKQYLFAEDLSVSYGGRIICRHISFSVSKGERIALTGKNGSGKSSILKLIAGEKIPHSGVLHTGSNMVISTVPQEVVFRHKNLREYAQSEGVDETLIKSTLTKLGFDKIFFDHELDELSDGQKKKIALAGSLSQSAHLYVWDEPLNAVDIISRIQIEELILKYQPTMIFVEHDKYFVDKIATKIIEVNRL